MKYSDLIFSNKASESQLSKIKKLEGKANIANSEQLKTEKDKYVRAVTGVPEFDQAVVQLSQYTMSKGTAADKRQMTSLENKMRKGDLSFEDVDGLNILCDNNFKLLFTVEPDSDKVHPTVWFGVVFAIAAVALRVCYEFDGSKTLMVFLTILNLIAIAYTLISWHKETIEHVEGWLDKNHLNQAFKRKIIGKVSKKLGWIVAIVSIVTIVWLVVAWTFNIIALGNDTVSIVSLAMSILEPYIVGLLAQTYEWNIYHNES